MRDISGNIKLGDFGTSRQLIAITNQNQPDSGTIGKTNMHTLAFLIENFASFFYRYSSLDSTGNNSRKCFWT
jgi:hypothetical protein